MKPGVFAVVPLMCLMAVFGLFGPARAQTRAELVLVDEFITTASPDGEGIVSFRPALPGRLAPAPQTTAFMATLAREMAGQPVVAVDSGWPNGPEGGVRGREGQTLLARLQDICAAFSLPEAEKVPFAVRGAWALAPATREEVNLDFTGMTTLDVAGSTPLFTQVLGRLNAMQARALTSPQGLDVGGLPMREQEMVLRALRTPFEVVRWKMERSPEGMPMRGAPEVVAAFAQPLKARGLRLRTQMRSQGPEITTERRYPGGKSIDRQSFLAWQPASRLEISNVDGRGGFNDWAEFSILREVPNTFKPSDMDGAKVRQPIGIAGVHTVEEVLKQAQKVTGIPLVASGQYRGLSAFVGSASLLAGDVLDAIRLCLNAAWRKVGDTYVLAWDRRGLGVLQELSVERAAGLRDAISRETQEARDADIWLTLAMQTPFAADDPLAWTEPQRKAIFSPRPEQYQGWEWPPMVMFAAMTPAQQQGIRAWAAGRQVSLPDPVSGEHVQRAMTDADLARVTLPYQARLELLVELPGAGWCSLGDWWQESIDSHRVQSIRDRQRQQADEAKRKAEQEEYRLAEAKRLAASPNAVNRNLNPAEAARRNDPHMLPPAKRRGVMVPALVAERLGTVARLMAARGFDTLFYPVLSEGYATFPSKAFPPHPELGAANGWADAVKAAKANGITIVGYVEELAWRRPGAKGHWLERFPLYLDVDIAGRTLSESLSALATRRPGAPPIDVVGDLVRPREPEVEKRLTTLLSEYMAQPGSSGLLLDAWSIETSLRSSNPYGFRGMENTVRLGYSVPDRLASLKADGVDPVDLASDRAEFRPRGLAVAVIPRPVITEGMEMEGGIHRLSWSGGSWRGGDGRGAQASAAYMALATKILPKARPDGAPWTTYAVAGPAQGYGPDAMPVAPAASTVLLTGALQNQAKSISLFLRVPRREAVTEGRNRPWGGGSGWPAIAMSEGQAYYNPMTAARDLVVYDFRAAPEELLDSLRRVGLPED